MEVLIYLLKVNLFWVILFLTYSLLLHRHTFFILNRGFLLLSLLAGVIFPMLHLPEKAPVMPTAAFSAQAIRISAASPNPESAVLDWPQLVLIVLLTGSAVMIFNFLKQLKKLKYLIDQGHSVPFENHTLILLPHSKTGSFSFMKYLVLNKDDYENHLEEVVRHELVHIRQVHSLDIIIVEILKIICWFNPVLWLYKVRLQEVHEFLADEEAPNRDRYTSFLMSYALNAPVRSLTNHFFNSSLLKNRIVMIYKNRTSRWLFSKYFAFLPIIGILVLFTAARKQRNEILTSKSEETLDIKGKITDENGKFISNAIIVLKGTTTGTTSSAGGNFELKAVPVNGTAVVSHVNYLPVEFKIEKAKSEYFIKLKKDIKTIDRVVIQGFEMPNNKPAASATSTKNGNKTFTVMEQNPEFPGGMKALILYIARNVKYPTEASNAGIEGEALLSFTISERGFVRNPQVIKGLGSGIDEEAIRVVLAMPTWKPAIQNGHPVAVEYHLPIQFDLEKVAPKEDKEKRQGSAFKQK